MKLIATEYTYTLDGERNVFGSYLGKRIASKQTIRKAWKKSDALLGYSLPKKDLTILGSYESKWISK